jgi:hypothetical protein
MLLYIMQLIELSNFICKSTKFMFLVIKLNLDSAMEIYYWLQMTE